MGYQQTPKSLETDQVRIVRMSLLARNDHLLRLSKTTKWDHH